MANKKIFASKKNRMSVREVVKNVPIADAFNAAGGKSYSVSDENALAQLVCTCCFNDTFYKTAEEQTKHLAELCGSVSEEFLAKAAVYGRTDGKMKDAPALLLAALSTRDNALFEKIFDRVVDNAKMLRNFVQIIRSGVTGRKSFGSLPKKMIRRWLDSKTDEQLFKASIGNDPSMSDIVKMVHPRPKTKSREALYGYFLGQGTKRNTPKIVKQYEAWKNDHDEELPDLPFEFLTSQTLTTKDWKRIAERMTWTQTRMNLNTMARHGCFSDSKLVDRVAEKLRDPDEIKRAKMFPYQLFVAFINVDDSVPTKIKDALQDALDIALENVPKYEGKVYVFPDVSGSMSSPLTGQRAGSTSKMRCIDIAALISAAVLRRNKDVEVIPFEVDIKKMSLNSRDSVMTNAQKLASIGGGGTNCAAPLEYLNKMLAKGDLLIYVSDNESWYDAKSCLYSWNLNSNQAGEWEIFSKRNPNAKMVCINVQTEDTVQTEDSGNVLNIGGFSDSVFDTIADFVSQKTKKKGSKKEQIDFAAVIRAVEL